jgi:hypothetical protein
LQYQEFSKTEGRRGCVSTLVSAEIVVIFHFRVSPFLFFHGRLEIFVKSSSGLKTTTAYTLLQHTTRDLSITSSPKRHRQV